MVENIRIFKFYVKIYLNLLSNLFHSTNYKKGKFTFKKKPKKTNFISINKKFKYKISFRTERINTTNVNIRYQGYTIINEAKATQTEEATYHRRSIAQNNKQNFARSAEARRNDTQLEFYGTIEVHKINTVVDSRYYEMKSYSDEGNVRLTKYRQKIFVQLVIIQTIYEIIGLEEKFKEILRINRKIATYTK